MAAFLSHTYTFATAVTPGANQKYWTVTDIVPESDRSLFAQHDHRQPPCRASRSAPSRASRPPTSSPAKHRNPARITGPRSRACSRQIRSSPAPRSITCGPTSSASVWSIHPITFDPARLDPDNPPPAPWTLQPSNPRLLNALDAGLHRQQIRSAVAHAPDRELEGLPAFVPL